jgi:hypothetical protein
MTTRRDFLKTSFIAVAGAAAILPSLSAAEEKRRGGSATTVDVLDENSPQAKALNYKSDSSKLKDKVLMTERQGVPFKNQKCSGCGLYQGKIGEKQGPCAVFPGKVVATTGWCTSWNKKA